MTEPDLAPRRDRTGLVAAAVFTAAFALAAYIWRYGPAGPVPLHIGLAGRVDRWGDRAGVAAFLAATTAGLGLAYLLMGALTAGREPDAPARRGARPARQVLILVEVMISGIAAALAFGDFRSPELNGLRVTTALLALLFLGVGALVGKARPNPFVGVRTYWALRSRLAWDKSNRLAGRLFFWIGALGLIASPFATPYALTPALIVAILAATAVAVFESWRVWRTDPERQAP